MKIRKLSQKAFDYQAERQYYGKHAVVLQDFSYIEPYFRTFLGDYCAYFDGKRVLDIGAGECVHGRQVCTACNPQLYVNLDLFSVRMLPVAQHNVLKQMHFISGDCFSLPFHDKSFDVVWGNGILFRLRPLDKVVAEISRVLRPGGAYLGMEPNFVNPLVFFKFMLTSRDNNNDGALLHGTTKNAFGRAGLKLEFKFFWKKLPWLRNSVLSTSMGLIAHKPA